MSFKHILAVAVFSIAYPLGFNLVFDWFLGIESIPSYLILEVIIIVSAMITACLIFVFNHFFIGIKTLHLGCAIAVAAVIYFLSPSLSLIIGQFISMFHLAVILVVPITIGYLVNAKEI